MTTSKNPSDQLRFSLILGMAFASGAGLFAWQGASRTAAALCLAGGGLLAVGSLRPEAIGPLACAWEATGRLLESIRDAAADRILLASSSAFRMFLNYLPRKVR